MTQLIFEVHGASFDDDNGVASGWNSVRLSQQGMDQATQLGSRYAATQLDAVFYSDLKRSEQTVTVGFEPNPHKMYSDWRLRDCDYGDMTGSPVSEVNTAMLQHITEPFAGGESIQECVERVKSFLMDIQKHFDGKTVLIVGHPATLHALQFLIGQVPLEQSMTQPFSWQPGWKFQLQ